MSQVAVTKKHPGGRPTKYRKEYCKMAVDLGKEGKTLVHLANTLGVTKSSINEWGSVHPEFSHALAQCKAGAEQWLLDRASERMAGGNVGASDTLLKFMLSAAHGYREKTDVTSDIKADVTHKGTVDITFVDMVP